MSVFGASRDRKRWRFHGWIAARDAGTSSKQWERLRLVLDGE